LGKNNIGINAHEYVVEKLAIVNFLLPKALLGSEDSLLCMRTHFIFETFGFTFKILLGLFLHASNDKTKILFDNQRSIYYFLSLTKAAQKSFSCGFAVLFFN
jgi:hypothetical protein